MKFGNGPENKNGFVAMTHYCVLAVHLAFNVLRSPNHLHTLDAEARAQARTVRLAAQASQQWRKIHSAQLSGVTQLSKIS